MKTLFKTSSLYTDILSWTLYKHKNTNSFLTILTLHYFFYYSNVLTFMWWNLPHWFFSIYLSDCLKGSKFVHMFTKIYITQTLVRL